MLAHSHGSSQNGNISKETIQKSICVMYGKTIKETQSNIHKNQRNPMKINENQRKRQKTTENQRKAKESKKLKGNQGNL